MRVGVLVDLLAEQQAALGEVVDQAPGDLRVLDEASLEADDPVVEVAVEADRVVERRVHGRVEDPVLGGDRVVVLAEGRGDVDEAGPVLGGDEIAGDTGNPPSSRSVSVKTGPLVGRPTRSGPGNVSRTSAPSPRTRSSSGSATISVSPSSSPGRR